MIYIIGHKNPDTDSVISAITYAHYLGDNYKAQIAGELNPETKYILQKFNIEIPEIKKTANNEKYILVDHNEEKQRIDNLSEDKIIEIIDHHKFNFQNSTPIKITVLPWGSTASIIANLYFENKKELLNKEIAGLLLSAILSDTVIFKSATCTEKDKELAKQLAKIAEIDNIENYGIKLFKEKSKINDKTAKEIINLDAKEFEINNKKLIVAQIELVDLKNIENKKNEILNAMKESVEDNNLYTFILMISDVFNNGSYLWIEGNKDEVKHKLEYNDTFLKNVLSRKKQIIPLLNKKL